MQLGINFKYLFLDDVSAERKHDAILQRRRRPIGRKKKSSNSGTKACLGGSEPRLGKFLVF
jgi:hypothetical protein